MTTNPGTNTVVVGPRESLGRRLVEVEGRLYRPRRNVEAKLRYRSPAVPASVEQMDDDRFSLRLDRPAYGVAAGQTAVLYDGDAVVGSGTITAARRT